MVRETDKDLAELTSLYNRTFGSPVETISPLPGAGSDRKYFRIHGTEETVIGVVGPDRRENSTFTRLSKIFLKNNINVPWTSECFGTYYLEEDLGDVSLFSMLKDEDAESIICKCMDSLVNLQKTPLEEWEQAVMCKPFDKRQVMWDLNYFKYEYLKSASIVFDEDALENDFEDLAMHITHFPKEMWGFMYRDCQSRNVMVKDGEPYWIDFQGGRVGPVLYDAVSFLWQAKAGFSPEFRQSVLSRYISTFAAGDSELEECMHRLTPLFVLFRTLQVLGAYGFRGLIQHRSHFIESIPGARANLSELLDSGDIDSWPELRNVAEALVTDHRFRPREHKGLVVEVFSFSYKKGYPADYSGNGGGFMFDCRGMHNPGRYEEYKPLTGLDSAVRDFLEQRGEVQGFLADAWGMTDPSVECYMRRGFTSLQIGFGCTGGRHRSVYCADRTAKHIKEKYPNACVVVNHREQNIREEIKS